LEIHVLAWNSITCGGVEPVNKIPILRLDNGSPTAKHIKICTDSIPLRKTACNHKINEPENCENRNDPDLVQVFLKNWWVESDFKAPNLPLSLWLKVSGCHYNSIYNNTGIK
jgi:hypothetical protein